MCSSAAARLSWRAISTAPRDCRSRRSPTVSVAPRRRSMRTSMTRRGEGTRGQRALRRRVAGLRAPTPRRATARATVRTARRATRARSSAGGRSELVVEAMWEWRSRYGQLPSSYDWSRTHAVRRGGDALARLSDGDWPSASLVTGVFGSWTGARADAATTVAGAGDRQQRPDVVHGPAAAMRSP